MGKMITRNIVTENIFPPIPSRQFDWYAYYDGIEDMAGYGPTEQEAIDDLMFHAYPVATHKR
jgi:hypothetical protein